MTDPAATVTDHPAPTPRPRSGPRWWWLGTGLAAAAVLTVVAIMVGSSGPAPADDRAISPVAVDGLDPVQLDGEIVTTPCFSYRVPEDLTLDPRSAGCATVVGFGDDYLTQIMVGAQTSAGDDLDEVVAEMRRAMSGAGDVEVDPLTVRGREAVRIRNVDGWGLRRTSYVVSLPAGRFTQEGKNLTSILLTGPASPEFDDWMATILDSVDIPGD